MKNPQLGEEVFAPNFYDKKHVFVGYGVGPNVVMNLSGFYRYQYEQARAKAKVVFYGLFVRDPAKYEAKAQYYRQQGNEKAVRIVVA